MPIIERKDFIARVAAEQRFKQQLREQNTGQPAEYDPPNYYGNFLKRQIEELE